MSPAVKSKKSKRQSFGSICNYCARYVSAEAQCYCAFAWKNYAEIWAEEMAGELGIDREVYDADEPPVYDPSTVVQYSEQIIAELTPMPMPRGWSEQDWSRLRERYIHRVAKEHDLSVQGKLLVAANVIDTIFGFGPIGPMLRSDDFQRMLIDGASFAVLELDSGLSLRLENVFTSEQQVWTIAHQILKGVGLLISEEQPHATFRLPSGAVSHVTIPPATLSAPLISVVCRQ